MICLICGKDFNWHSETQTDVCLKKGMQQLAEARARIRELENEIH